MSLLLAYTIGGLLAFELGLDLLLGGFAAGVITRQVLRRREIPSFDSKLTAVVFGVFVLFLVVRGTPALLLYRGVLNKRERIALALMCSTQLPLVLAITTLATSTGHMLASTAAALVGAAVLSTLVFPAVGLRLRSDAPEDSAERLIAAGI